MRWLLKYYKLIARVCAWIGIVAIIVLSVVPADDRPVTGTGQSFEHLSAFALVAAAFTIGYRYSLMKLVAFAFLFCGGIELLQVPVSTRHARVSDFVIDFAASCLAICAVVATRTVVEKEISKPVRRSSSTS